MTLRCGFFTSGKDIKMRAIEGFILGAALALTVPAEAYYLGAPDAAHSHAARRHEGIPSLARDPATGRLWAVWYGGITPAEDSNNYLMVATSVNDGDTWREVLVYDPDGMGPVRAFDPEMWISPDGKLQLTWTERAVPVAGAPTDKKMDFSHFAGHTNQALASDDRLMMLTLDASKEPCAPYPAPRQIGTGVMMCKPILGPKGEWFFPASIWWTKESAGLLVSEDGGNTFTRRGGATISKEQGQTFDEHSIVLMKDGSIRSWIRTKKGAMESFSKDGGRTWSPIEAATFANTPTRCAVTRLASGNILLIKNGNRPDADQGRKNLTAYVSDDEGRTWKGGLLLDARPGATYPDFALGSDGTIYAVWDCNRTGDREILFARFTEADVRAGKPVSPQTKIGVTVTSRCKPAVGGRDFPVTAPTDGADATAAVQAAFDACFKAGGGTVTLNPGTYNVGGLRLRSRTTLHLKSGAVLKGARDCVRYRILAADRLEPARPKDLLYPGATWAVENVEYDKRVIRVTNTYGSNWNDAMIRIYDAVDVAVVGERGSVIDGCNSYDAMNEEKYRGVHGISVHYATNVVFRGLALQHTGNWAFCVREARNLVFDDLDIIAGHDGPHFSTCNDVVVKNCRMATGDDCIAGFDNEHVRVRNCDLNTACSAFRFGGYDVLVENTVCHGPAKYLFRGSLTREEKAAGAMAGIHERRNMLSLLTYYADPTIKVRRTPGKIVFRNVTCTDVDRFLHYNYSGNERWQRGMPLSDVSFEKVKAKGIKLPLCAYGDREVPFSLSFKNVSISFAGEPPEFIRGAHVKEIKAESLNVEGVKGPFFRTWGGEPKVEAKDLKGLAPTVTPATEKFRVRPI